MKASDSTNSLTELTKDPKACFICLDEDHESGEPLVDSKLLRNCGCRFTVHPTCWNEWIKGKSDYDCPICRKDSMLRIKVHPNPVLAIEYVEEQPSHRISCSPLLACFGFATLASVLITAIILWG